jgi:hypothetical protein
MASNGCGYFFADADFRAGVVFEAAGRETPVPFEAVLALPAAVLAGELVLAGLALDGPVLRAAGFATGAVCTSRTTVSAALFAASVTLWAAPVIRVLIWVVVPGLLDMGATLRRRNKLRRKGNLAVANPFPEGSCRA